MRNDWIQRRKEIKHNTEKYMFIHCLEVCGKRVESDDQHSAKGTAENVNYLYNKYVTWKSGSLQIEKLAHFALK